MVTIRRSNERGKTQSGWLDSNHTFSFGHYYDSAQMGFGPLRVINQDLVKPGAGFDTHGHRDMEIISYVLDGALEHRDSIGTGSVIHRGDIQRMTAGKGILHSEFNHSSEDQVEFLQIWIEPKIKNLEPGYQQLTLNETGLSNQWSLVASPAGDDQVVLIHQDVHIYLSKLDSDRELTYSAREKGDQKAKRGFWLQVIKGEILVNEHKLGSGDGAQFTSEPSLSVRAVKSSELMLFDVPINP